VSARWKELKKEAADDLEATWWLIRDFCWNAVPVLLFLGIELIIMAAFGRLPIP